MKLIIVTVIVMMSLCSPLMSNAYDAVPKTNEELNLPDTAFNKMIEQDEMKKFLEDIQDGTD